MTTLKRRGFLGLLGVAAFVLVLGACGSSEDPTATPRPATTAMPQATFTPVPTTDPEARKYGGTLVHVQASNPGRWEPILAKAADKDFMQPLYGVLMRVTPEYLQEPQLAKSWEFSGDNTVITLHLADATFHDGTEFNAAAVKASFDNIKDPDQGSLSGSAMKPVERVEIVDNKTVKITLAAPDAVFFPNLGDRLGMIPSLQAMNSMSLDEFNRKPIGAGAFKRVDYFPDSVASYERWDKAYNPDRPYLDALEIRIINDSAVALANFRAGDVDSYVPDGDQVPLLQGESGIVMQGSWAPQFSYFAVNRALPPTDNVLVRKAMSHAINRADIVELECFEGTALWGPISPAYGWVYDASYKKYAYDVDEAKRLLAQAGYAGGFTLGPVLWYGQQASLPRMSLFSDMFADVGITLDLQMMESAQASRMYQRKHEGAAYSSGLSGATDIDRTLRNHFYSDAPRNVGQINIPGVDQALDNARAALDLKERAKFYLEAQDLIVESMGSLFVYDCKEFSVIRDFVKGFENFPENGGENWFEVWLEK